MAILTSAHYVCFCGHFKKVITSLQNTPLIYSTEYLSIGNLGNTFLS